MQDRMQEKKYTWGQPSALRNIFLIDKHRLRDRTDVIREREKEIERRKKAEADDSLCLIIV